MADPTSRTMQHFVSVSLLRIRTATSTGTYIASVREQHLPRRDFRILNGCVRAPIDFELPRYSFRCTPRAPPFLPSVTARSMTRDHGLVHKPVLVLTQKAKYTTSRMATCISTPTPKPGKPANNEGVNNVGAASIDHRNNHRARRLDLSRSNARRRASTKGRDRLCQTSIRTSRCDRWW